MCGEKFLKHELNVREELIESELELSKIMNEYFPFKIEKIEEKFLNMTWIQPPG